MNPIGKLYMVATPIGNYQDITLRAVDTLRKVDAIICEEIREGTSLLKKLEIQPKELLTLNEHNEADAVPELLMRLINGQNLALITDCGTPVFADPGHSLILVASESGVPIIPVPGVSSLMAALSILDFSPKQFYFAGFIPPKPDPRRAELLRLRAMRIPVILMDTPYRMAALLQDVAKAFGKNHTITLATDLTLPSEHIYRGTVAMVQQQVGPRKAEFILIVH
jgi:16S rRNA (cytidine1402-2'-O)-methyltransferase